MLSFILLLVRTHFHPLLQVRFDVPAGNMVQNLEIHAANGAYRKYLRGEKGTLEHDETKVLTSCGFPKLPDSES
jgi:hypothetical protein